MTKNSLLCQMMNEQGENWRKWMKENHPSIIVKDYKDKDPNNPYVLFMYSIGANFSDPLVKESRGIIIDENTQEAVCFPFKKFGKYNESYADEIDWSTARVQEKIDGSIIKLWWSEYDNKWVYSSNSMIYAEDAYIDRTNNGKYVTLQDIIDKTSESKIIHNRIKQEILNKDYTYIFELVSPHNQVVVKHNYHALWHIGTRNNKTCEELDVNIGIRRPELFKISSLEDCIDFVSNYGYDYGDNKIKNCDFEGFVVVDKNWNRIKIKSPLYQMIHNIVNNGSVSKEIIIGYLLNDMIDIEKISEEFPDKAHWFKYYDFKVSEFLYRAQRFINIIRDLYEKSGNNRKTVALIIKNHKLSSIGFKCIDNELTLKDILTNDKKGYVKNVSDFIDDYKPENLSEYYEKLYKNMEVK